jgi:hypothetical protein
VALHQGISDRTLSRNGCKSNRQTCSDSPPQSGRPGIGNDPGNERNQQDPLVSKLARVATEEHYNVDSRICS